MAVAKTVDITIHNFVAKNAKQKGGFHEEVKNHKKSRRNAKSKLKSEYFSKA